MQDGAIVSEEIGRFRGFVNIRIQLRDSIDMTKYVLDSMREEAEEAFDAYSPGGMPTIYIDSHAAWIIG